MQNKFEPLNIFNEEYQMDGSYDIFKSFADAKVPLNRGFAQSQIMRYMLTANVVQYRCKIEHPTVLDYGCGVGTFKMFWDANYQVADRKKMIYTGVEANQSFVAEGLTNKRNIISYDANNDDIAKLNLGSHDIVLMQQFIEHIDRRSFMYLLEYTQNTMNEEGYLIISAPNPVVGAKILEHYHDYEYPLDELKQIVDAAGFNIHEILGWLGHGEPSMDVLSASEQTIHSKMKLISKGYADAILCLLNPEFAPYYYLILQKK